MPLLKLEFKCWVSNSHFIMALDNKKGITLYEKNVLKKLFQ